MGLLSLCAGKLVYLDTNVFIYALEGYPAFAEDLTALFEGIDRGDCRAVTSELTLAEALVKPIRDRSAARQQAYEAILTPSRGLAVRAVSREILLDAARIRARSGHRLPDAIHLATAKATRSGLFLTNDKRIAALDELEVAQLSDSV